jgi:UDP-N-acetylmuramoyl-L-alanyl-D-glutamate--2,6-diaminopimelate ligase
MRLELSSPVGVLRLNTRLVGDVNAYNIMACVGASLASGIDKRAVVAGIESLAGVPGRMEPVENRFGLTIIVDFAHTPDALKNALASARSLAGGRLISIFGCGGNRDRAKRPVMGSIAEGTSDIVVVTSDNPRKEDPKAIIEDILDGIEDRSKVMVEPDRSRAIRLGITLMKPDDCLLIAGKGHETYQIIGAEKRPFDDRTCVTQCLEEIYGP